MPKKSKTVIKKAKPKVKVSNTQRIPPQKEVVAKPIAVEPQPHTQRHIIHYLKLPLWFLLGAILGLFFVLSFLDIFYQKANENKIYPGISVNNQDMGGKTREEIEHMFAEKNNRIQQSTFTFRYDDQVATISAKQLNLGYDEKLIAEQAYSLGRSSNFFSNSTIMIQAYTQGIDVPAGIRYDDAKLISLLEPIKDHLTVQPVDARFTFQNNRVTEFRASIDGKTVDLQALQTLVKKKALSLAYSTKPEQISIAIPITVLHPAITTDKVNNLGIKELVGTGTSLFHGSIENRIYNISLASSRLNGVLIPPNTVFSFDQVLGDVSSLTGYKQAYVIQNGRTVLGDGGGVCQVSTTFFRAVLDAGYPIVERNAHAYRVHYYEEDSDPGIDAAIYWPTVDLKFKNDSGHYLLVQTIFDPVEERLTFNLYGTKDNREVSMTKPVILSQTAPPPPLYQDDPTLPKGQTKQVDFEAWGANVYFTRTVKKDGNVIISDKFTSNYRPWQAIFLRGTM